MCVWVMVSVEGKCCVWIVQPPSLASLVLTESVMLRYHNAERQKIVVGPASHAERINAQNRYFYAYMLLL